MVMGRHIQTRRKKTVLPEGAKRVQAEGAIVVHGHIVSELFFPIQKYHFSLFLTETPFSRRQDIEAPTLEANHVICMVWFLVIYFIANDIFCFWNRIWKFQFLLNPLRTINGPGVFLRIISLFRGAVLGFGNLTGKGSMRRPLQGEGKGKCLRHSCKINEKSYSKPLTFLRKYQFGSIYHLFVIQKKSVTEYAQFIGKERTRALFQIIICCKSTDRNGEFGQKKKQICKVLCSCAGQLGEYSHCQCQWDLWG